MRLLRVELARLRWRRAVVVLLVACEADPEMYLGPDGEATDCAEAIMP